MKKSRTRYIVGLIFILAVMSVILFKPYPILFSQDMPFIGFLQRTFYILLFACILCLYRILRGPTSADRAVTIDMLGVLIVGFCAIMGIATGRSWYIDIAIAWALQSFIATLALAKFLEGKSFDD
ncbi:MAG: cation:proton antiporter [Candidatus Gorgyraea atricola]|nr:cation:proton antiporter [Candidatus Gorgyraea atricola]